MPQLEVFKELQERREKGGLTGRTTIPSTSRTCCVNITISMVKGQNGGQTAVASKTSREKREKKQRLKPFHPRYNEHE